MLKQSSTRFRTTVVPSPERASEIAVAALGHLAQDTELIASFMVRSGLAPQDLRAASSTPQFQAALLDFLCSEEGELLAFCANTGESPQTVDLARKVLSGPEGEWSA